MSVPSALFAALQSLVAGRVHPNGFPQAESLMIWPAIRYQIVSVVPGVDVCGDGGDDSTADVRVQIDVVAEDFDELLTLVGQVRGAIYVAIPQAVIQDTVYSDDEETRTHRAMMDYIVYQ